jgi:hypothetical protein
MDVPHLLQNLGTFPLNETSQSSFGQSVELSLVDFVSDLLPAFAVATFDMDSIDFSDIFSNC